jgi:tetratricopeptide (TPR) repeat protein
MWGHLFRGRCPWGIYSLLVSVLLWISIPVVAEAGFKGLFTSKTPPAVSTIKEDLSGGANSAVAELVADAKKQADAGNYRDAITDYTRAIELNPHDAVLYYERGSLYYYLILSEIPDMASSEFFQMAATKPLPETGKTVSPAVIAEYCTNALTDLNLAITLQGNYDIFYYMRGLLYSCVYCPQQNSWKAISNYDRALGINAKNAVYYLERGLAWARLNQFKEAVSNIDRAIQMEPANYYFHYEKGLVQEKMNMSEQAAGSYLMVMELAATDRVAAFVDDLSRARKGNCQELLRDYTDLIVKRPAVAAFYVNRALCLANLKKYAPAGEDIATAIALQNNRRDLYFLKGKILYAGGLKKEAVKDFDQACRLGQPAGCYYLTLAKRELVRGEEWVPFWYSRDKRQYFYHRKRIKTLEGSNKTVQIRVEEDVATMTPTVSGNGFPDRGQGGYQLDVWEVDCARSQLRIASRKRLDGSDRIVTEKNPYESAFRSVFPGELSYKLYRIVCRRNDDKKPLVSNGVLQ